MPGATLKRRSRELMFENAPKLFLITAIFIVIVTVLVQLQSRLPISGNARELIEENLRSGAIFSIDLYRPFIRPVGVLLSLVISFLLPLIDTGYLCYSLKISCGVRGDYSDLFEGFTIAGKVILLTILIGVFTLLWSLLFIIPGLIASYRYRMAYFILLDNPGKSALQCIRESKELMAGNKMDLFLLDLSFIGWYILDVLISLYLPFPLPIVSVWLVPYRSLSFAGFYNHLIRFSPEI